MTVHHSSVHTGSKRSFDVMEGPRERKVAMDDDTLSSSPAATVPFIKVPPDNPRRTPPKRKVVFVDPDDVDAPWWWPAMVVPKKEIPLFRQTVDGDVQEPADGEYLVCYFEDGSFSIVPESDALPFCPWQPPYTTYVTGPSGPQFRVDKAVILATWYWETGNVPSSFVWLKGQALEDRSEPVGVETSTTTSKGGVHGPAPKKQKHLDSNHIGLSRKEKDAHHGPNGFHSAKDGMTPSLPSSASKKKESKKAHAAAVTATPKARNTNHYSKTSHANPTSTSSATSANQPNSSTSVTTPHQEHKSKLITPSRPNGYSAGSQRHSSSTATAATSSSSHPSSTSHAPSAKRKSLSSKSQSSISSTNSISTTGFPPSLPASSSATALSSSHPPSRSGKSTTESSREMDASTGGVAAFRRSSFSSGGTLSYHHQQQQQPERCSKCGMNTRPPSISDVSGLTGVTNEVSKGGKNGAGNLVTKHLCNGCCEVLDEIAPPQPPSPSKSSEGSHENVQARNAAGLEARPARQNLSVLRHLVPMSKKRRWIERYEAVRSMRALCENPPQPSPQPPPPPPQGIPTIFPTVIPTVHALPPFAPIPTLLPPPPPT
ncbi:hypothetical protein HK102_002174, partial [Quaeritorhiza haematococci]